MYRIIWFSLFDHLRYMTPWIYERSLAVAAFHNVANSGNAYSVRIQHAYHEEV